MTAFDSTRREAPRLPRDDFDVPFEEALRWARERKAVLPEEFYGARLQAVRARSFSIAGLSALDQLQQVADSLAEATAAGQTMREWQRTLPSEVFSLGRARRELIFRNAVQTHYGIGRTIQQRENATARPFLMWDAINDSRTRPAHAAMDGHIAPIDDAIWKTWTPPAGHNCRCTRISLTEAQARARGYPKAAPQVQPDKGWEGDPTDDDAAGRILADRIARAPYSMAEALRLRGRGAPVVDDQQRNAPDCDLLDGSRFAAEWCIGPRPGQVTWKDAGRPDLRRVDDALRLVQPAMLPRAESRADAAAVLAKALGLSDAEPLLSVATPVENALLRVDLLQHMVDKEEDARERYANFILPTLRDPFEVWAVDYADGIRNRYIGLFRGPRDFMVVLRVNLDGSLTWNIMQARPKDMNMHRIGAIRYGK